MDLALAGLALGGLLGWSLWGWLWWRLRDAHSLVGAVLDHPRLSLSWWRYEPDRPGAHLSDRLVCCGASSLWASSVAHLGGSQRRREDLIGTTHTQQMPARADNPVPGSWEQWDAGALALLTGERTEPLTFRLHYPAPVGAGAVVPVESWTCAWVTPDGQRGLTILVLDLRDAAIWLSSLEQLRIAPTTTETLSRLDAALLRLGGE